MEIAGFRQVGIIGAGQMGSGIAQVCSSVGLDVILLDIEQVQLDKAQAGIKKSADKLAAKGVITEINKKNCLEKITYCTALDQLSQVDIVIEAAVEKESVKCEILKKVDTLVKKEAVFASNTSSIPITRLAAATQRPDRFIGMHFMNPVPIMRLVEVIPGMATDKKISDRVVALAKGLGKEISFSQDYPGFVVNRVLMPMINEAFYALMEGVATAEDIDLGMKLGTNQPMGPLTLADFIGLDTCLAIMRVLYEGYADSKYRPSPLLIKYVEAGFLGRKTGKGVYTY